MTSARGTKAPPLAGVRIVSMAQNVPGPVAVARLVAEGAAAVKVEPPWGDPLAAMSRSWYDELHAGMEIRQLDLKAPEGSAALLTLLEQADVFIASHRPSALSRLALDPQTLTATLRSLRCLNIVGETGNAEAAGHDLTYQAKAGLVGAGLPQTLLADLMGAERAYAAVLLLLREPPGSWREVGLYDSLGAATAPIRHGLTVRGGTLGGALPAYGVYETRDGHVAVAALEPHFRARLYAAVGLADGAPLADALRARTALEWEQWAVDRDIPLVAIRTGHPSAPLGAGGDTETRRSGLFMKHSNLLNTAHRHAAAFLGGVADRHVGGQSTRAQLLARLGGPLPDGPSDPVQVIDRLAENADPGVVATVGPRYFGFVTGGAVPVTVAADWLASAWDQNGAMYVMSPAASVMEDVASAWILDLLGLPSSATVGFVTGCHMANFTCLAAARHEVLRRVGWNVEAQGLQRAPRVRVIVGGEVHISAVGALRLLGFGAEELVTVPVDGQGRMRADALARALTESDAPTIVCAQVGNVSTGASDPVADIVAASHGSGAWVHVDGAFGLWAAAVPELRPQVAGVEGADSWATDAHKWLNVPYDSGLAIVAHAAPHRAAMGLRASYLQRGTEEERIGMDWVPESSRRSRGIAIYALLRALGRQGLADLIRRNCALARRMAERLSHAPGVRILNDVVLNQVLVQFAGSPNPDETTRDVVARVQADGTCWAGGAVWQGTQVMRISVSNWSTTEADIDRSADAIVACYGRATETQRHREDKDS